MKIDQLILDEICKACGREKDPILKQQLSLLCLALHKPIDLINVLIAQYSSLHKVDLVNNLLELRNKII